MFRAQNEDAKGSAEAANTELEGEAGTRVEFNDSATKSSLGGASVLPISPSKSLGPAVGKTSLNTASIERATKLRAEADSILHPHPHPSWAAIVGRLWKFNAPELCWFLLSMITAVITGAVLPIFALLVGMALSVFFEMNNEALSADISFWAAYRNADGTGHSVWPLCFPPTVCH